MKEEIIIPTGNHPMRHSHVCRLELNAPIFSRVLPLRDQIDFSDRADQIKFSPEIEQIYLQTLEQELLQVNAYHTSLLSDSENSATPLGAAFNNLNRMYFMMQRTLEFLETISPSDMWQSNLLHELNTLLSAEEILAMAQNQKTNPIHLFSHQSTLMHFKESVQAVMHMQKVNDTLFFDETLNEFFNVVEHCAKNACDDMSVEVHASFNDQAIAALASMTALYRAKKITAVQFADLTCAGTDILEELNSGRRVTRELSDRLSALQFAIAPPATKSAQIPPRVLPDALFQPVARPPTHTGNVASLSS